MGTCVAINKGGGSSLGIVVVSRSPPTIEIRSIIDIHVYDRAYLRLS